MREKVESFVDSPVKKWAELPSTRCFRGLWMLLPAVNST